MLYAYIKALNTGISLIITFLVCFVLICFLVQKSMFCNVKKIWRHPSYFLLNHIYLDFVCALLLHNDQLVIMNVIFLQLGQRSFLFRNFCLINYIFTIFFGVDETTNETVTNKI